MQLAAQGLVAFSVAQSCRCAELQQGERKRGLMCSANDLTSLHVSLLVSASLLAALWYTWLLWAHISQVYSLTAFCVSSNCLTPVRQKLEDDWLSFLLLHSSFSYLLSLPASHILPRKEDKGIETEIRLYSSGFLDGQYFLVFSSLPLLTLNVSSGSSVFQLVTLEIW